MGGNGFSIGGTNFDQLWRAAEQKLKDSGNSSPTTADIVNEIRRLNPKPPTVDSPIPGFHFEHNDVIPSMKYAAITPQLPGRNGGANTPSGSLGPVMKYGVHLPHVPQLSTKYAANTGCAPTPFVPSSGVSMKYAVNVGCNPQVRQTPGKKIKVAPSARKSIQRAITQVKLRNMAAQIQTQYKSEG